MICSSCRPLVLARQPSVKPRAGKVMNGYTNISVNTERGRWIDSESLFPNLKRIPGRVNPIVFSNDSRHNGRIGFVCVFYPSVYFHHSASQRMALLAPPHRRERVSNNFKTGKRLVSEKGV